MLARKMTRYTWTEDERKRKRDKRGTNFSRRTPTPSDSPFQSRTKHTFHPILTTRRMGKGRIQDSPQVLGCLCITLGRVCCTGSGAGGEAARDFTTHTPSPDGLL